MDDDLHSDDAVDKAQKRSGMKWYTKVRPCSEVEQFDCPHIIVTLLYIQKKQAMLSFYYINIRNTTYQLNS